MVWPQAMVRVWAPNSLSRCQVRPESRESTPSRIKPDVAGHNAAHVAICDEVA